MVNIFEKIKSKWNENRILFILQGVSLVLAFVLIFVGFCTSASAETDIAPIADNVIPSGHYQFNTTYAFQYYGEFGLNFVVVINSPNTEEYFTLTCSRIRLDTNTVQYYVTEVTPPRNDFTTPSWFYAYNNRWLDNTYNGIRDIYVLDSQTVSTYGYNWFIQNATRVGDASLDGSRIIAPGTYVASATPSITNVTRVSANIDFDVYAPGVTSSGESVHCDYMEIGVESGTSFILYRTAEDHDKYFGYAQSWLVDSWRYISVTSTALVSDEFYSLFNSIYSPATEYERGYMNGFEDGYWKGNEGGYESGYTYGYDLGYERGVRDTVAEGNGNWLSDIFGSVMNALDSLEFFEGYSLLDFFKTCLGVCGIIWLLKLLAGG